MINQRLVIIRIILFGLVLALVTHYCIREVSLYVLIFDVVFFVLVYRIARKRFPELTRQPTMTPDVPDEWGASVATAYDTPKPSDQWRCALCIITADFRCLFWPVIILAMMVILPALPSVIAPGPEYALAAIALRAAFGLALIALVMWESVESRYPRRDSIRKSTVSLYSGGFVDVTATIRQDGSPEPALTYNRSVPWTAAKAIKIVNWDVFFVNKCAGMENFLTRRAFADRESAEAFVRTAKELLRANLLAGSVPD